MSPRKVPPPIPVVGGQGGGDTSREQQLREWEQAQRSQREQQAAAVASALPVAPALVPVQAVVPAADPAPGKQTAAAVAAMPDPDSAPADQLVVCERGIHGAKARWKEKVDAATEEFIEAAGPYLC